MAKDKCVLCGKDSPYEMDVNIEYRTGYIEGAGQLCENCWDAGTKRESMLIQTHTVSHRAESQTVTHIESNPTYPLLGV